MSEKSDQKSLWHWKNLLPAIAGIGLYKLFGLSVVPAILAGGFVYSKLKKKNKVLSVVFGLISGVVVYLIFITFLYAYLFE
jgi:hypothetical protein|tara:strand:+ start:83 stop:325 length:243 start_codon:yes stop_codon:yes gene_type:complete